MAVCLPESVVNGYIGVTDGDQTSAFGVVGFNTVIIFLQEPILFGIL